MERREKTLAQKRKNLKRPPVEMLVRNELIGLHKVDDFKKKRRR